MNIYIACALTHVPREIFHEYSNWIHSLAKGLSQNNNVKYALINSDPELSKRPESNKSFGTEIWLRNLM